MAIAVPEPLPIHRRILAEIEGNILSGRWRPGHRLPVEVDLAEQYGCSRMTVNKALIELARQGLIERRRKSGSFVRQPQAQSAVLAIRDIRAEVEAMGVSYGYELLSRQRRKTRQADRRRLGRAGTEVLALECRHMAGGMPFCLEDRIIDLEQVKGAGEADFGKEAPGPWLLARVPWSSAEHRIRACGADGHAARLLGLEPGSACLAVERRTWLDGVPLTHVRLLWPAERHELVATFGPGGPGGPGGP
jgi:GntR family transcriptional regulator, histidine utilization repressor